ncbi:MAG: hypothetical protein ACD_75C00654G0002 [uncultured bacterium]|nr:MAG: hypothetical protein ACD_75C00654G0002 [uncultured bacterium]
MLQVVRQQRPVFHHGHGGLEVALLAELGLLLRLHAFEGFEEEAFADQVVPLLVLLRLAVEGDDLAGEQEIGIDLRQIHGLLGIGQLFRIGDQAFDLVGKERQGVGLLLEEKFQVGELDHRFERAVQRLVHLPEAGAEDLRLGDVGEVAQIDEVMGVDRLLPGEFQDKGTVFPLGEARRDQPPEHGFASHQDVGPEQLVLEQDLDRRAGGFLVGRGGFEAVFPGLVDVHEKEVDLGPPFHGPLFDALAFFPQHRQALRP